MDSGERIDVPEETNSMRMIDTHCHIDQFASPEAIVFDCETRDMRVVAVTYLPSHFAVAADRLRGNRHVTAALGMHPLFATKGIRELAAFKRMVSSSDFIGEIGLDFSRVGESSAEIQERVFEEVLRALTDRPRFVTLHSRGAEKEVLESLKRYAVRRAVFHWYTGEDNILDSILSEGHFLSINPAMLLTKKGLRLLSTVPRDRILVESDGPFAKINKQPCQPSDIIGVYLALGREWNCELPETVEQIGFNFNQVTRR